MSREGCRTFMLTFTLGVPSFILGLTVLIGRLVPPQFINLPYRNYWLAREHAEASIAFLCEQGAWFSCVLLFFLGYVDVLVVRANSTAPVGLPAVPFATAMALFLLALGWWLVRLVRRFGRPPA